MLEVKKEVSDFFVGGIAPFYMFESEYNALFHLVESHKNEPLFPGPNLATKAALISLVAHFEAFSKHQFAALVNIWPDLLRNFAMKRPQASISLEDLSWMFGQSDEKLGFVIAEQYDFGSAAIINGLFRDLVTTTPFSGEESDKFDSILTQRHLLVHHAGYYTL